MKVLFYSSKEFEMDYIKACIPEKIEVDFVKDSLSFKTAALSEGYEAISIFTADDATAEVIDQLKKSGVKYIAVRAAGYDNVDLEAAGDAGIRIANVPEYSPSAVAEHTVALMLALNRKLIRANEQVKEQNFTLDNLVGFDLNKKKVGIIGTGRIGSKVARILNGFGCTLMAYDINQDQELEHKYNVYYSGLYTLCSMCDIITIHLPLNDKTRYLINKKLIDKMKRGVMLINTSRGAVVNTIDIIDALQRGHIGYYGMDVYENERGLFFYDHTGETLKDNMFRKLTGFPNVLITPHQAFATREALTNIATTTFQNLMYWNNGERSANEITCSKVISLTNNQEVKSQML